MIYRQTANPNATNSELDSKIVITKEDKLKEIMWNSKLNYNDRVKLIKQLKGEK